MVIGVIATGDGVSLGTGIVRLELTPTQGKTLPGKAVMLLGVKPLMADITPTTVQSISASLELTSDSIENLAPYITLFPPVGAGLGLTFNTFTGMEYYEINAPLQGGEAIHAWGQALVANTVAPQAMAWMIVSTDYRDFVRTPQNHRKIGTLTSMGTTVNSDVPGTPYSITGVRGGLTEIFGLVHPKTIAAGDAILGQIKISSSELEGSLDEMCPLYAQSFGLGATGSMLIPGVARQKVNIPKKLDVTQVNIQDNLRCSLLPASAGSWISGVAYV